MAAIEGLESQQDKLTFTWKKGPNAPSQTFNGTCTAHGRKAYFSGWGSNAAVYEFDADTGEWSTLPDCPISDFSLAVVDGLLTAVGGDDMSLRWFRTNVLLSYKDKKWVRKFPSMPTRRSNAVVVSNDNILVVIGGYEENRTRDGTPNKRLETVEIMDIKTKRWFTAAPLPYGITGGSATICGDYLYIMGGYTTFSSGPKVVSFCSLEALLHSNPQESSTTVWQETKPLPVDSIWSASVKGQLLAIGGVDFKYDEMTPIRMYNSVRNSWDIVTHMTIGRSHCLAAVLSDNQLIVVGGLIDGQGHDTDEVEIASIK